MGFKSGAAPFVAADPLAGRRPVGQTPKPLADRRRWLLTAACRLLAACRPLPAAGCRLLAAGCWLAGSSA
ncbi:hypothetical protein CJU94_19255 [Paraburkholderia aromaticivorans]|uniref:Uncharacterized protein n=1 Tax=Paraburkholderia aromaticivorans TaxID=2026199 RepID=A0A248VM45_9BURK|nr:hypothetical protein CJU94_19255 [Paraburkholderia aromaticivorans]